MVMAILGNDNKKMERYKVNKKYMLYTWIALSLTAMTGCTSVLVYNAYLEL